MNRRVLVCGGRDWAERELTERVLRDHLHDGDTVVHGGASGADALAGDIAGRVMGMDVEVHPADWKRYGKAAGPIRNKEMLESGIDYAIVFPGGRGTADMLARVQSNSIPWTRVMTEALE